MGIIVLGGFYGWIYETLFYMYNYDELILKRGSCFGPWIDVYCLGGVLIYFACRKLTDKPWLVFFVSGLLCGALEYIAGSVLDRVNNGYWGWNYNTEKLNFGNLNGYVCLRSVLFFGLSGLMLFYVMIPALKWLQRKIGEKIFSRIFIIFGVIVLLDIAYNSIDAFHFVRIKAEGTGTSRTITVSSAYEDYWQLTAAIWSDSNEQDDKTWQTMIKNDKGKWTAKVDFINFKGSGTGTAHIFDGSKFVCEISFNIPHKEWLKAQSDRFKAEFLKGTNSYANIDYIQCAVNIANDDYYGYDHTWRANRHTMSCSGLVDLCLTHCGYGDLIKDDPPALIDGRRWGYLDLGTYSGKYDWKELMTKEIGAIWYDGTEGVEPGDILYYDFDINTNHTGFYLGNGVTIEARGPATHSSNNDDSRLEIATFSDGLNDFPWQGYFRIPNKNKAW